MRDRLSCVVELRRFGVWRSAVIVVAAVAVASMAAWGGLAAARGSSAAAQIATVAGVMACISVLLAASLARVEPGTLARADGAWSFTVGRGGRPHVETGELAVAIDLGAFLLLTLTSGARGRRRTRRWLPVQRGGLETSWHALRCAVYSPPPVAPARAAACGPLAE